ncbi:MAG: acetate--CoA ligase family protein [Thermodesulfobacteriota bacterium]
MEIIEQALARGQRALTEYEAKKLLSAYGIPVTREQLAGDRESAAAAAAEIGYPVVLKGSGADLMHKSEAGAVWVNINGEAALLKAYGQIEERMGKAFEGVLVQEMVAGKRELVVGLHREPRFGPCVMLGLGGVLTEIINDTSFRIAPFDAAEAMDMAEELRAEKIFQAFRGETAADMPALCQCLTAVGRIGEELPAVSEIDINPLIITPKGALKAVDALIVIKEAEHDTNH